MNNLRICKSDQDVPNEPNNFAGGGQAVKCLHLGTLAMVRVPKTVPKTVSSWSRNVEEGSGTCYVNYGKFYEGF